MRFEMRVASVPDRCGSILVALARAEHLGQRDRRKVVEIWIVPTVAIEIGAGRMQFTTVPSGAISEIGRVTPSFHVTSQARSGNIGAKHPAPGGPVATVDAEIDLRAGAGEVVCERVIFLGCR